MNHLGGHSVISVQRMLRRFRLITLLVVQHGLLLNEFDFSRAVRQKGDHERTIDYSRSRHPAPSIGFTTTPVPTAALITHSSFPAGKTLSSRSITTPETLNGFWAIRQSTGMSSRRCVNSPEAWPRTQYRR